MNAEKLLGRGESGWCLYSTSDPGVWVHAVVRFHLRGVALEWGHRSTPACSASDRTMPQHGNRKQHIDTVIMCTSMPGLVQFSNSRPISHACFSPITKAARGLEPQTWAQISKRFLDHTHRASCHQKSCTHAWTCVNNECRETRTPNLLICS